MLSNMSCYPSTCSTTCSTNCFEIMLGIIIDLIARTIQGLVTSFLDNFRLNDINEARVGENLLDEENIPSGFNEDDSIYVQYAPGENRPSFLSELKQAFHSSLGILCCGLFIGVILSVLMFIDINTGHVCHAVEWNSLPLQIQRLKLTAQIVENFIAQMLHFVVMVSMFGVHYMSSMNLFVWNITFGCIDTIYRLFLQVYGEYEQWWKNYISHYGCSYVAKNTFYLFALKKVFYVLKKVFYIQKSLLCSQKSLSYSKNVFYVINEKFFFVLKTKVF